MKRLQSIFKHIPRSVYIAVLFSLVIQLAGLSWIAVQGGHEAVIWGDAIVYEELAVHISEGRGFTYERYGEVRPELFRTPGMPYLMSHFIEDGLLSFSYFFVLGILQALIVPPLIFFIGSTLFRASIGIIATWVYVLEPLTFLSYWSGHTEGLFMLLTVPGIACFIYSLKQRSVLSALCAGLLIALSLYVRPVLYLVYIAAFLILIAYLLVKKEGSAQFVVVTGLTLFILLIPWMNHVKDESGVYALTASGWRNVYTDYISSIRSIQNNSVLQVEKENLKVFAKEELGISRAELDSPESSDVLKAYSLNEIMSNLDTVIKMETVVLFNFFLNTSYQARLEHVKIIPKIQRQLSPTQALLNRGFAGIGDIYNEMKRVYFVPVLERVWSTSLFILSLMGAFLMRKNKIALLLLFVIALTALISSVAGLGMVGRLRVPILPFYFIFVAIALEWLFVHVRNKMGR